MKVLRKLGSHFLSQLHTPQNHVYRVGDIYIYPYLFLSYSGFLFIFKNVCVFCVLLWFLNLFDRKIVDRIDSDGNGYITMDELNAWIKRVQKRYVYENVAKVWSDYDLNKDNKISWEEYKQATYGYYLGEGVHTQPLSYRMLWDGTTGPLVTFLSHWSLALS